MTIRTVDPAWSSVPAGGSWEITSPEVFCGSMGLPFLSRYDSHVGRDIEITLAKSLQRLDGCENQLTFSFSEMLNELELVSIDSADVRKVIHYFGDAQLTEVLRRVAYQFVKSTPFASVLRTGVENSGPVDANDSGRVPG